MMEINIFILHLAFIFLKKKEKLKHIAHIMANYIVKLNGFMPMFCVTCAMKRVKAG